MRIGELAILTGERVGTLRFWTDQGLLITQRQNNNYRMYGLTTVQRVSWIRQLQSLGFNLRMIRELLGVLDAPGSPCHDLTLALSVHLDTVQRQLAELGQLEATLIHHLAESLASPCETADCRYFQRPA